MPESENVSWAKEHQHFAQGELIVCTYLVVRGLGIGGLTPPLLPLLPPGCELLPLLRGENRFDLLAGLGADLPDLGFLCFGEVELLHRSAALVGGLLPQFTELLPLLWG